LYKCLLLQYNPHFILVLIFLYVFVQSLDFFFFFFPEKYIYYLGDLITTIGTYKCIYFYVKYFPTSQHSERMRSATQQFPEHHHSARVLLTRGWGCVRGVGVGVGVSEDGLGRDDQGGGPIGVNEVKDPNFVGLIRVRNLNF